MLKVNGGHTQIFSAPRNDINELRAVIAKLGQNQTVACSCWLWVVFVQPCFEVCLEFNYCGKQFIEFDLGWREQTVVEVDRVGTPGGR